MLTASPTLRRAYYDCRFGQLHVHQAMPGGGGFEEATTLLCIPGDPGTGRVFSGLLIPLGRDRSVYAIDLPGCGESDPPTRGAGPDELAAALVEFLGSMRIRRVDLLACAEGIPLALTLARELASKVGRVALLSSGDIEPSLGFNPVQPLQIFRLAAVPPSQLSREIGALAPEVRDFLGTI